ncbi:CPCC family cysteine-rich protein [Chryseobacterium camelliae]|uniref:CPCC family cysteine-rich protein n=1 Tax=Chryseobacterium camelliae TaxID=1265445 RepID=UPI003B4339AD
MVFLFNINTWIYTLKERGNYFICKVCFWEDDGCIELTEISGPNYITLGEGRNNFLKFGACEEKFVKNVVENPETKFRKGDL